MEINRRGFIARLIGGVVLAKVLPESLVGSVPKVDETVSACEFINQLNEATLTNIAPANIRDFYFRSSPMLAKLRENRISTFKGGDYNA